MTKPHIRTHVVSCGHNKLWRIVEELLIEIGSRRHVVLVIRCCGVHINKINLIMVPTYLVDPFILVKICVDLV